MLVAAIRNHMEYKITPPANTITNTVSSAGRLSTTPACRLPQIKSATPRPISGSPAGESVRIDSQNWLSIGLSSTKSRVPSRTWVTIAPRFGRNQVVAMPSNTV